MSDKGLYEKLIEYRQFGRYPFHMPGHKRQDKMLSDAYEIDITEINGFDNLHHPEGIIKESMDNASEFFGTDKTWFLVNGSSCGLLAAIHAVTEIGDSIIIGRNCHKSVYNAIELRNLKAEYIYPQIINEYGINGGYKPEAIENLLKKAMDSGEKIKAVVVTSPTYEGIVSDIERIAEIVHRYGSILIVDEAHGAHLGIHEGLPKPAYKLGADIVIESAHKTLPAMTQTAFLHLCGRRVQEEKIQDCLTIYQTSSPSYVLMASLDKCIRELQTKGKQKLKSLLITLDKFYEKVNKLENITVLGRECIGKNEIFDFDICKLVILINTNKITGKFLEEELREKYGFEMEMTSARYVLGMTTMYDNMEQILKLADALTEIDSNLNSFYKERVLEEDRYINYEKINEADVAMSIYEAKRKGTEDMFFLESEGKVSAEYIYVYPPEIPLVVPGEMISKKMIEQIDYYKRINLNVKGIENKKIRVVT